jgi:hypothetical protein
VVKSEVQNNLPKVGDATKRESGIIVLAHNQVKMQVNRVFPQQVVS